MAGVRLYLRDTNPPHEYRFIRPDGTIESIPGLRLKAFLNLSHMVVPGRMAIEAAFPDCVVDTGSFLTIIPEMIWRHFRPGVITWLPFAPGTPPGLRRVTIAGGTFLYDLGEITLSLQDPDGGALDATVVAKFTRDGGALNIPFTLGLRGGVLDGRHLTADPDPAAPHGQGWALRNP